MAEQDITAKKDLQSKKKEIEGGIQRYQSNVDAVIGVIMEDEKHLRGLLGEKVKALIRLLKVKSADHLHTVRGNIKQLELAKEAYQDAQRESDEEKRLNMIMKGMSLEDKYSVPSMQFVTYAEKKKSEIQLGNISYG